MNCVRQNRVLVIIIIGIILSAIIPYIIWGDSLEATFTIIGAREWISDYGSGAGFAGIGLLVADLILPIPSTLVMSALGLQYGTWIGGLYAVAGNTLAGLIAYGACRWLGRPLAVRLVGENGLKAGESLFVNGGAWLVAVSRCLPILPEAIPCLAGLHQMPFNSYFLALLCGSLPGGFLFAAIGEIGHTEPIWALGLSVLVPIMLWLVASRWLKQTKSISTP